MKNDLGQSAPQAGKHKGRETNNGSYTDGVLSVRLAIAADIVGVSPSTLDRWRRDGLVLSVRINGVRLYRIRDLDRLLDEHTESGEGGAA